MKILTIRLFIGFTLLHLLWSEAKNMTVKITDTSSLKISPNIRPTITYLFSRKPFKEITKGDTYLQIYLGIENKVEIDILSFEENGPRTLFSIKSNDASNLDKNLKKYFLKQYSLTKMFFTLLSPHKSKDTIAQIRQLVQGKSLYNHWSYEVIILLLNYAKDDRQKIADKVQNNPIERSENINLEKPFYARCYL